MKINLNLIKSHRPRNKNLTQKSANNFPARAEQLLKKGRTDDASKMLLQALKQKPDSLELLSKLAAVVDGMCFPSMLPEYISFLEKETSSPIGLQVKKCLGMAYYKKGLVEATSGKPFLALSFLGKAEKTYLEILEIVKEDADQTYVVLSNLGYIKTSMSEFDMAINYFKEAIKINPEGIDAIAGYVEAASSGDRSKEEFEKLLAFVDLEIRKRPNSSDLYTARANVLTKLNPAEAIRSLKRAVRLDPNALGNYYSLTILYAGLGKKMKSHYWAYKANYREKGAGLLSYLYHQIMGYLMEKT